MHVLHRLSIAAVFAASVTAAVAAAPMSSDESARAADTRPGAEPVIVELYTSQGCNSCPPADAFLGELAKRPDVLPLALHVDYWDYIGWKDPFAKRAHTDRQRAYSRALWQRFIYTPQMVVDGRYHDVGSDRDAILKLIERARAEKAKQPLIKIVRAEGPEDGAPTKIRIDGLGYRGTAAVWLALYDREHQTDVPRGENAGRRLVEYNIVRELRRIGAFDGRTTTLALDIAELALRHDAGVIFVQQEEMGPILGCFTFDSGRGKRVRL